MNPTRNDTILKDIGNNIRKNRIKLNLSQMKLADRAMVHRNYISSIENGRRNPTILILLDISYALGIDIIELIK